MNKILTLALICLIGTTVNAQDLEVFKGDNGKYGYKAKNGEIIIAPKYTICFPFEGNYAVVRSSTKEALINKTGKVVTKFYEDIVQEKPLIYKGLLRVIDNGMWFIIDTIGSQITSKTYEGINMFYEDFASVNINGKRGFIDITGKEVISCKYDWVEDFREGFAQIKQGNKKGFIDKTGKEIVPCKYDNIRDFSEGMAAVNVGYYIDDFFYEKGSWGFIDYSGQLIIPLSYESILEDFKNGKAKVIKGFKIFYIDKAGKEVK